MVDPADYERLAAWAVGLLSDSRLLESAPNEAIIVQVPMYVAIPACTVEAFQRVRDSET